MPARRTPPLFLFNGAPTSCYLLDEEQLLRNVSILERVQERTGARILLALKAFSAWTLFPLLSRAFYGPLWGTCASSVHEARLGREEFGGEVHVFAAAFRDEEVDELLPLVDHITFNSIGQWRRFAPKIATRAEQFGSAPAVGIRINPEHSEVDVPLYDPCSPASRLGVRKKNFDSTVFDHGVTGLHFHTLCEESAEALERTLVAAEKKFAADFARCSWINMGGGHHITRSDYNTGLLERCLLDWKSRFGAQIYLEPGEAVALDAGWLTATVLDIVEADMPVAILDVSPTCHMPDVLEMPYRPPLFYAEGGKVREAPEEGDGWGCRLAGGSCLAGDVIPYTYVFREPLRLGARLVFGDMAIYTMVKNTHFNGLPLPSIGRFSGENVHIVRRFGYEDFKNRLS
ncbi:MAG: carboxynorspermidine decarboxylase [Desulfovibrio sp.]|nr:carboxynorspermidine decarboxylase [Desulfovibrio sp.]